MSLSSVVITPGEDADQIATNTIFKVTQVVQGPVA
jgi:hypothetical protein